MCGRFTLIKTGEVVAELFELADTPDLSPRYNIAPTQPVAAVVCDAPSAPRRLVNLRWGLIPTWAKDPTVGSPMINARADTIATKPSFRSAFKKRRCLIVADGFYEWQKVNGGKQPQYITMSDRDPFAFAGLWEHWRGSDGQDIYSCTIITTEPNELMKPLHDRMPVILPRDAYASWLDPNNTSASDLQSLLCAHAAEDMCAHPVSLRVNNPAHDVAACVQPVEA